MPAVQKPRRHAPADPITSKDNRWLKRFRASLRDGEIEDDIVGLEGPHLVEEALHADLDLVAMLVSPSGENHFEQLQRRIPQGAQVLRTTDKLFESVAGTRTPQGVAALAKIRRATLDEVVTTGRTAPLLLVLVAVQDPGNVGTMLRTAEGLGATGAVVTTGSASPWGQKSLRASAGSSIRMPILAGMATSVVMAQLRVAGLKLVATAAREGVLPSAVDWNGPTALFVGNEGAGLPPEVIRSADQTVHIPLATGIESLNAAVAASILLYEAARQRGQG